MDAVAPFAFDYRARQPEPPLGRFVESIWYARGTIPYSREKIAPTGSTVAVFVLGDPIRETARNGEGPTLVADRGFLIGPHTGPVINEPTGETFAVGIVGTPIGCEAVFGLRPGRLRGQVVDLLEAWAPAAALRDALLETGDPDAMLSLVEHHLARSVDASVAGVDRCERAVAMLEEDPTRSIASIAEALEVTHGHLDRELARVVGLTPRALARLLRMRRLLSELDVSGSVAWASLAAELGWYDQAHLVRDFKRHTGVTPTQYLDAQRKTFSPVERGEAAGFVPEE